MIKIAIVEDGNGEAGQLLSYLEKFREANGEEFEYRRFHDAASFLEDKSVYDIIFMDIMLPNITGMEAAERLRRYNSRSILIFVTSMAQFAVKGYKVDALDYILKPVTYDRLIFKLQKALEILRANEDKQIIVSSQDGIAQVSTGEIYYIEVSGHNVSFHTKKGVLMQHASLREIEDELRGSSFMRCNSCYLINPKHIVSVKGFDIVMADGSNLRISQPKRKKFIEELTNWLAQGRR